MSYPPQPPDQGPGEPPATPWQVPGSAPGPGFGQPEPTTPLPPQGPYGAQPPSGAYPQGPYASGPAAPPPWGQQPYDPNVGPYAVPGMYAGGPPPPSGPQRLSRNAIIAIVGVVAVIGAGLGVYFATSNSNTHLTPTGLGTSTSAPAPTTAPPTTPASSSPAPTTSSPMPLSTDPSIEAMQELVATMSDPGCKAAYTTLITFDEATSTDADDESALLQDYSTAVSGLTAAQQQAQSQSVADAIGGMVADWKNYVDEIGSGQTPDDSVLDADSDTLAAACID